MPAGNPKGKGPSAEARALSAATRRREADDRLAGQLRSRGWLPIRPEVMDDLHGRPAGYIAAIVAEEWERSEHGPIRTIPVET